MKSIHKRVGRIVNLNHEDLNYIKEILITRAVNDYLTVNVNLKTGEMYLDIDDQLNRKKQLEKLSQKLLGYEIDFENYIQNNVIPMDEY